MNHGFVKDPDAILDYGIDWSSWLQAGESLESSQWFVVGTNLLIGTGAYAPTQSATATKVWLSGGTIGRVYSVTNRVTTNSSPPRTEDRTLRISVVQR